MNQRHVFVDYENTQELALERIEGLPVIVHVVIGAQQKDRLPFERVALFQKHAAQVKLEGVSASGRNALDLHIAFLLGQLSANAPDASFHIVSHDGDYDPLIKTLKDKGFHVERSACFSRLPFLQGSVRPAAAPSPKAARATTAKLPLPDQVDQVEAHLRSIPIASRPRKLNRFSTWVASSVANKLSPEQIAQVVDALQERKVFSVSEKGALLYAS